MLLVQKFLKDGNSLEELQNSHGVKHYICNGKIGLTYDQINSKESDPLAQQCRGLILRENTYEIVACPMFRFFNMQQNQLAAKIDFDTAKFEDKLDGTLIVCYFDHVQQKWYVGTRSRPEADGNIDDGNLTFADLFDMAVEKILGKNKNIQDLMHQANKNCTYCFELTSPFNRIVCEYREISLTLLAVRCNLTLKERHPEEEITNLTGVLLPEIFKFNNLNSMLQVITEWNPSEKEGIVIKDANFNRIKVKNPAYVAYNHMRDSLSTSFRGCAEVILLGKDDDVISMMPNNIAERIKKLKPLIQQVLKTTSNDYLELKHFDTDKEFALEAKKKLWPAALFWLRKNKVDSDRLVASLINFIIKNDLDPTRIPKTKLEGILKLCEKIDPTIKE